MLQFDWKSVDCVNFLCEFQCISLHLFSTIWITLSSSCSSCTRAQATTRLFTKTLLLAFSSHTPQHRTSRTMDSAMAMPLTFLHKTHWSWSYPPGVRSHLKCGCGSIGKASGKQLPFTPLHVPPLLLLSYGLDCHQAREEAGLIPRNQQNHELAYRACSSVSLTWLFLSCYFMF